MSAGALDIDALRAWIGRRETRTELLTEAPLCALDATLDREAPVGAAPVPPLHHWLFFLPVVRLSQVGADGHPARGGFLPPVPLPRRMWAAGRLQFARPLRVGEAATRTSEILDVSAKSGRSGTLVFVKVRHELADAVGVAIVEEQDIVYREDPRPGDSVPEPRLAPVGQDWMREIRPDPVLLFRYSALTFNGHRIHYDRPYATGVEGYAGLVVHGPLLATLLADLVRRHLPDARLSAFEFRAARPVFDAAPFHLCGEPAPDGRSVRLWVRDANGALCMDASATLF
ncbi:MaoC family dehydratase N-terminal domain-containing protein [Ideonella sp. B508-1]|uniref:FAS1-like dehydratase domain-containing protein n=1 Tax=Ideonella sp. B508-1 TaxID=137716 RepID=UPI00034D5673|nr:MaoC family dehydratase N-terminal domain-containing protein [Ideonella sp. B508-1]